MYGFEPVISKGVVILQIHDWFEFLRSRFDMDLNFLSAIVRPSHLGL